MRIVFFLARIVAILLASLASTARAQSQLGYQANLNHSINAANGTLHGVSGVATITGSNTIHISNFTYNGGGIEAYFYLATADTAAAIPNGVRISPNVLASASNNAFTFPNPTSGAAVGNFDLTIPAGVNLDTYNTLSLWCVVARADFASNTFAPAALVPEPLSSAILLPILLFILWRSTPRKPQATSGTL